MDLSLYSSTGSKASKGRREWIADASRHPGPGIFAELRLGNQCRAISVVWYFHCVLTNKVCLESEGRAHP